MLYAVISDIHANRQALGAVLADIDASGVDCIVCLGDVVGYGPAPAEVLQQVHSRVDYILLGNHDAVVGGRLDPDCFNTNARQLIEWTRQQVDGKARKFLRDLPAVLEGDGFRCAHADVAMPLQYNYILDPEDALPTWNSCEEQLVFVGHSHDPAIFLTGNSGRAYRLEPQDFSIEPEKRYIVNVGSVGQPRDGDTRACYCLFNSETGTVSFRRVAFDVESYRAECERRGVSVESCYFLQLAEIRKRCPVREVIDFTPLSREVAEQQGAATVAQLKATESRLRRWQAVGIASLLAMILACAVAMAAYFQLRPDQIMIRGNGSAAITLLERGVRDLVVPVVPSQFHVVNRKNPLAGWRVRLPRSGEVSVMSVEFADAEGIDNNRGFKISSESPVDFEMRSALFEVPEGSRLAIQGAFRTREYQAGVIEMVLLFTDKHGTEKVLLVKEPPGLDEVEVDLDWPRLSSSTMPKSERLEQDGYVAYILRGQFQGEVDVADCRLVLKKD
jgi:diadenosine tetraphosphatase ApaH/serine/threonine PP2A family protein phosphatase